MFLTLGPPMAPKDVPSNSTAWHGFPVRTDDTSVIMREFAYPACPIARRSYPEVVTNLDFRTLSASGGRVAQAFGGWPTLPHRKHRDISSARAALFPDFGKGAEVESAPALLFAILHFDFGIGANDCSSHRRASSSAYPLPNPQRVGTLRGKSNYKSKLTCESRRTNA